MFTLDALTAIIGLIITIFCNTIMQFFIVAATDVASWVTDIVASTLYPPSQSSPKNPLSAMSDLFNLSWSGEKLDLYGIVLAVAMGVAFICFVLEGIRLLLPADKQSSSNEWLGLILRTAFCFVAMVFLYGGLTKSNIMYGSGGILNGFFRIVFAPINYIYSLVDKIDFGISDVSVSVSVDLTKVAGLLIISGGILAGVLAGAMSILERFVTIALHIILGPLFIAFSINKEASKAAVEWFKSIMIQALCLTFSMAIWYMALVKLNEYFVVLKGGDVVTDVITGESFVSAITPGAIAIALFSVVGNIEELFKVVGFKTTSSRDASRMLAGGFMGSVRALSTAAGLAGDAVKGGAAGIQGAKALASKAGDFMQNIKGEVSTGQLSSMREQNAGMLESLSKTKARAENSMSDIYNTGAGDNTVALGASTLTPTESTIPQGEFLSAQQALQFAEGVSTSFETGSASIPKSDAKISNTDGAAARALGVITSAQASGGMTDYERTRLSERAVQIGNPEGSVPINGTFAKMNDGKVIPVAGDYDAASNCAYLSSLNPDVTDLSHITAIADADGKWVDVTGVQGLGAQIRGNDVDKYTFGDNQFARVDLSSSLCGQDVVDSYTNTIDHQLGGDPPRNTKIGVTSSANNSGSAAGNAIASQSANYAASTADGQPSVVKQAVYDGADNVQAGQGANSGASATVVVPPQNYGQSATANVSQVVNRTGEPEVKIHEETIPPQDYGGGSNYQGSPFDVGDVYHVAPGNNAPSDDHSTAVYVGEDQSDPEIFWENGAAYVPPESEYDTVIPPNSAQNDYLPLEDIPIPKSENDAVVPQNVAQGASDASYAGVFSPSDYYSGSEVKPSGEDLAKVNVIKPINEATQVKTNESDPEKTAPKQPDIANPFEEQPKAKKDLSGIYFDNNSGDSFAKNKKERR